MNTIIGLLERAKENAQVKLVAVKAFPICTDALDYRAVYEMAYDHLRDTIYLFRHARKLEQKLEAEHKPPKAPADTSQRRWDSQLQRWVKVPRKEQDASD